MFQAKLEKPDAPVESSQVDIAARQRPGLAGAWMIWLRALRLYHWAKNILVFVAPILGLQITTGSVAAESILLFFLMGMLASANYLINDVRDVRADRLHEFKRRRPIAAGEIRPRDALLAAAGLIVVALALSLTLPLPVSLTLFGYTLGALAYSLFLKREPIVDVFVLAGLYTLRIAAGGFLLPEPLSPWLFSFSIVFFLGLALIKRYAEIERALRLAGQGVQVRGYTASDLPLLLAAGTSSGIGAVIIFSIYLIDGHYPHEVYRNPFVLWLMIPVLLLWTLRIWHIAAQGRMHEDPVMFALKDTASIAMAFGVAVILIAAWL